MNILGTTDESYFDKPRIIRLAKKMLAKLRRKKILVDDIVQHINTQGITMTSARFEDLFTSRPNRVTIATPTTILAFISACFDFDGHICSATDILDFADAARLPLRCYDQLAVYFSTAEWQAAWSRILPTTKPHFNRHQLIHRRDEFNRLHHACHNAQHVIITGERGIGKTALAQSVVIELEMLLSTKVATLYLTQPLQSLGELTQLVAQALNIKPLHNEPIELRMLSVLNKIPLTYVFVDDCQLTETETSIVLGFIRKFPQIRLLMTTPQPHIPHELMNVELGIVVEALKPLHDTTTNSPAMLLFVQALSEYGIHYSTDDLYLLHSVCRQAKGNPRHILHLASMHTTNYRSDNEQTWREKIEQLNPSELSVFTFLAIIEAPISHSFLLIYFKSNLSIQHIEQSLQTLIQQTFIERIYSEQHFSYRISPHVSLSYINNMPLQRRISEYEHHIHLLGRVAQSNNLDVIANVQQHDMMVVLHFVQRVVAQHVQVLFDVTKLLVNWLQIWLYHDATSNVIVFAEQLIMQHRVIHPTLAELCVIIGRIYSVRGQFDSAQRIQHVAGQYVSPQSHPHIWAQSQVVLLSIYVSNNNHAAIQNSLPLIPQIIAALEGAQHRDWLSFGHHVISNVHSMLQDISLALASNEQSIQYSINDRNLTVAYVMTHFQRSLLYMYAGSYDIALAILVKLNEEIKPYAVPYYTALLYMRMAAIEALLRRTSVAMEHIIQSFAVLRSVGNLIELLFVADIYSLILYRQARFHQALEISLLCSKLRTTYGIIRISYFEQLVDSKRSRVSAEVVARVQPPADDTTIYDLIGQLSDIYETITPNTALVVEYEYASLTSPV